MPPTPDTAAQAFFRYLAGRVSVYLPAPFDPSPLESRMSQLSDAIAADNAAADAATARVKADVTALTGKVATLQAAVDAGAATPADLQALADLKAKLDAIDPAPVAPPAS